MPYPMITVPTQTHTFFTTRSALVRSLLSRQLEILEAQAALHLMVNADEAIESLPTKLQEVAALYEEARRRTRWWVLTSQWTGPWLLCLSSFVLDRDVSNQPLRGCIVHVWSLLLTVLRDESTGKSDLAVHRVFAVLVDKDWDHDDKL